MEWYGGFMVLVVVTVLQFIFTIESATSVLDTACSFENDLCEWIAVNLTRSRYPNALATTNKSGPRQAENGHFYIYLDTNNIIAGETHTGRLSRDSLMVPAGSGDICLRFWYHMFGETMGRLDVLLNDEVVWSKSGNQSNIWHCATVDINSSQSEISFVASMGRDVYSIIALDNIDALNTKCTQETCESLHELTTVKTETSQPSTTQRTTETPPGVTTSSTSTPINLEEFIPYIVGVPAAILVVGAVILCVCLKKQKLTKVPEPTMIVPVFNPYDPFPSDDYATISESREEVYDDLDEMKMIERGSENKPYDDAYIHPSSGHTNQVADDYEEPGKPKEQSVGNHGRPEKDDYLTPTSKQSDVASTVYVTGDDDYITPTNEHDGPRRMSVKTESVDLKDMHRASITSAEADYLVL